MGLRIKLVGVLVGATILMVLFVPFVFAGSGWSAPFKVTNNSVEDTSPSLAVHKGKAYIVFTRHEGRRREIILRTNAFGNWRGIRLTRNSTGDWDPDIAVDKRGKIHVAYLYGDPRSGGDAEVTYKTNVSGTWKKKVLTRSRRWEQSPSIATYKGKAHIVYGIDVDGGDELWYTTNKSGSWRKAKILTNAYASEGGSIAQHNGVPSLAYTDQMNNRNKDVDDEIYFGSKRAGWKFRRITVNSTADGQPDLALDSNGKAHIAYRRGDNWAKGGDHDIMYITNKTGRWRRQRVTNDSRGDNNPSIAVSGNRVFIAWEKWFSTGLWEGNYEIYIKQKSFGASKWERQKRLTRNTFNDILPSVAAYRGKAHLTFMKENPDGEIVYRKQL